MTDAHASLDELAALSVGAGDLRVRHEPTWPFPYHLWLPGVEITDGQRSWGASALGRTPEEAADRIQAELTGLPEGQRVEVVRFDQGRQGAGRSSYPTQRVTWRDEQWAYQDEAIDEAQGAER